MFWTSQIAQKAVQFWRSTDRSEHEVLLLLLGEESKAEVAEIIEQLNAAEIPFLGGIFPGVISGKTHQTAGAIAKALYAPLGVHLIQEMADIPQLSRKLEQARPGFVPEKKGTAITLVDGLMEGISGLLQEAYDYLGHAYEFLGGGAGSISLQQAPCLFSPQGFFQNAALICLVDQSSKAGIRHGWQKIHGPVVATQTDGNAIHELNWENAFAVYRAVVEQDSGKKFADQPFFDLAKAYPFGMYKEGEEDVVRDPIAVDELGHLLCVGEVPKNSVLHILKGETDALIQAAADATEIAMDSPMKAEEIFLVDCISRVIFLDQNFQQELSTIQDKVSIHNQLLSPEGILSLGEISSHVHGVLTFYNKTIIVGTLHSPS